MSETQILRPTEAIFVDGSGGPGSCSGFGSIFALPVAHGMETRYCFSGLSFGAALVWRNFETPRRTPTRAVISVTSDGSRPDIIADDGTFLSHGTYNAGFSIFWRYGTPGTDHHLHGDSAAYSETDTWVLPDSFLPIPTDWSQLLVIATIIGSVGSFFDFVDYKGKRYNTASNILNVTDVHVEATLPSPGISFCATHGSAGGDSPGGSLAI
jgi:hypothetical protein